MNPATCNVRDVFCTTDPATRQARLRQLADAWLRMVARQVSL